MDKKIYVFRVNYDDANANAYIMKEFFSGRLRQGWGVKGTSLLDPDGKRNSRNDWISNYSKSWGNPIEENEAAKRFTVLSRMLEIKKDDIIVIPKTRNSQTLSICTVNKEYWFDDISSTVWSDFRHCIGVDNIRSYSYDSCAEAKLVSAKFIAYQSPVNNIRANRFINNVLELYKKEDNFKSQTIRQLLLQIKAKSIQKISKDLLDLNPLYFEDIIAECLKTKGYAIAAMRKYDKEGADVDIVATFPLPFISAYIDNLPTLLIQIKKKTGIDHDDREGVDQLIKAKPNYDNPICILLNTAEYISAETQEYAKNANIKIIDGTNILELILTSDLTQPLVEAL